MNVKLVTRDMATSNVRVCVCVCWFSWVSVWHAAVRYESIFFWWRWCGEWKQLTQCLNDGYVFLLSFTDFFQIEVRENVHFVKIRRSEQKIWPNQKLMKNLRKDWRLGIQCFWFVHRTAVRDLYKVVSVNKTKFYYF